MKCFVVNHQVKYVSCMSTVQWRVLKWKSELIHYWRGDQGIIEELIKALLKIEAMH